MENQILLVDENQGRYLPDTFAGNFRHLLTKESNEKLSAAFNGLDPDDDMYWERWDYILDEAELLIDGKKYYLFQDGDLWAINSGYHLSDSGELELNDGNN